MKRKSAKPCDHPIEKRKYVVGKDFWYTDCGLCGQRLEGEDGVPASLNQEVYERVGIARSGPHECPCCGEVLEVEFLGTQSDLECFKEAVVRIRKSREGGIGPLNAPVHPTGPTGIPTRISADPPKGRPSGAGGGVPPPRPPRMKGATNPHGLSDSKPDQKAHSRS